MSEWDGQSQKGSKIVFIQMTVFDTQNCPENCYSKCNSSQEVFFLRFFLRMVCGDIPKIVRNPVNPAGQGHAGVSKVSDKF